METTDPRHLLVAVAKILEGFKQSSRHIEDVESVLKISGDTLDREYLKEWAKKLEVESLLAKIVTAS